MSNIESVIAEAHASADAQPQADATIETANEQPTEELNKPAEAESDEVVFPKKAVNAISRRDKQIGKLRAELAAERAAKQELEQRYAKPAAKPASGEPQEADFDNYHDYIRALNRYDNEQLLETRETKQKQTQQTAEKDAWVAERRSAIEEQTRNIAKENPRIVQLVQEYSDLLDAMPPEIDELFLEADNGALAFLNLAEEGKLEALLSMSPARAAMEIGRAQTQAFTKPRTKAPTPMPAARGSVPQGKSFDKYTPEEAHTFLTQRN